jgi:hypothetical protein
MASGMGTSSSGGSAHHLLFRVSGSRDQSSVKRGPDAGGREVGYAILALDIEQALAFPSLPAVRDPMDRLILTAARVTSSRLLSANEALDGHGVERLWE